MNNLQRKNDHQDEVQFDSAIPIQRKIMDVETVDEIDQSSKIPRLNNISTANGLICSSCAIIKIRQSPQMQHTTTEWLICYPIDIKRRTM